MFFGLSSGVWVASIVFQRLSMFALRWLLYVLVAFEFLSGLINCFRFCRALLVWKWLYCTTFSVVYAEKRPLVLYKTKFCMWSVFLYVFVRWGLGWFVSSLQESLHSSKHDQHSIIKHKTDHLISWWTSTVLVPWFRLWLSKKHIFGFSNKTGIKSQPVWRDQTSM